MAQAIAYALDAHRDPAMRDALADAAIDWESAAYPPFTHECLGRALGSVAVRHEDSGMPMREDRWVEMVKRIVQRPGAARRRPQFARHPLLPRPAATGCWQPSATCHWPP